ncbi:MAG TPA: EthD family reductase [Bacillus sp. (in: firmicutes)]|nr:EthD family reductase [Bacillus sp. (in: firmicutes)]
MTKLMIMYPTPFNLEKFDELYFKEHVPLAQQVKGVKHTFMHKVVQNLNPNEPFYLIVELEFEDLEQLHHVISTPEWEKVSADAERLHPYLPHPPAICICE